MFRISFLYVYYMQWGFLKWNVLTINVQKLSHVIGYIFFCIYYLLLTIPRSCRNFIKVVYVYYSTHYKIKIIRFQKVIAIKFYAWAARYNGPNQFRCPTIYRAYGLYVWRLCRLVYCLIFINFSLLFVIG